MYRNCYWISLPVCCTDRDVQPIVNASTTCESYQEPVDPHKQYLESAGQISKSLQMADKVFVGFVSAIVEYNFTHPTAQSDVIDNQLDPKSEALLDEMQWCYTKVFEEPQYPITKNRIPLSIYLAEDKLPPPKRKLYPLSEPGLQEL